MSKQTDFADALGEVWLALFNVSLQPRTYYGPMTLAEHKRDEELRRISSLSVDQHIAAKKDHKVAEGVRLGGRKAAAATNKSPWLRGEPEAKELRTWLLELADRYPYLFASGLIEELRERLDRSKNPEKPFSGSSDNLRKHFTRICGESPAATVRAHRKK